MGPHNIDRSDKMYTSSLNILCINSICETRCYLCIITFYLKLGQVHLEQYRAFQYVLSDYKIYNKKTKGPTLMELFTTTGKLKKFFFFDN